MIAKELTIQLQSTLGEVMARIESNLAGVCFILDGRILVGLLTDGDVRRSILNGALLNDPVGSLMNRNFSSLQVGCSFEEIQKNLTKYKQIPILNESNELLDVATALQYHQIPLAKPFFGGNELEYVTDCILGGWVSSQGKYVNQFEEKFGEYVNCENSLAVSNGTVALHLALVALGVGPGDEVVVPNLTFASPVNAILYVGATPVLVDVDRLTMAINPDLIKVSITPKTKAIIPVHLYGHPADMDNIMTIAKKFNLLVIEDCAEALGSKYRNKHMGCFGDAATYSFFGNKTITTGEGGMILFRDPFIRSRAKVLRDHGMSPDRRYWHNEVGFNYRLTNMQAALGVAQLEQISYCVEKKRFIAEKYSKHLNGIDQIQLPIEKQWCYNTYWLYTIVLKSYNPKQREGMLRTLNANGVEARPVFYPLHRMPIYSKYIRGDGEYNISNKLSDGGISLPSSVSITESEIKYICDLVISNL